MGTIDSLTGGGSVSLSVDGNPEQIDYGASVSGRLTTDSPSDRDYEGYYDPYAFRGSEGDIVHITLRSGGGDPYLFLIDQDGNTLESDDDVSFGNYNSAISGFELPADGGYGILAGSYASGVGFGYELGLSKVQANIDSIAVGETKTSTLDIDDPRSNQFNGYHERVTLDAASGTTVDIEMTSTVGDTYLYLLDPNDIVVAQNDDYDGLNSRIPNATLSASGDYTIIATSFSPDATFVYDLTVRAV
ncbi:PPC domain-containing protein [Haloarchaeobius litoreus]|uniref:PPC domain-containing protein n=1 Tax=Haloarchaeobius litoreus TaxID=755306 RepID=A0ABD6DLB1_9EURY|nr:PPC domain-containing protein [Haloarchaeobius litoreus]